MAWVEHDPDRMSKALKEGSYLCRLEYPDGRVIYRVKQYVIYGVGDKRGYFATNGGKFKITHIHIIPPFNN